MPAMRRPSSFGNRRQNVWLIIPPMLCPTNTIGPFPAISTTDARSAAIFSMEKSPLEGDRERPCPGGELLLAIGQRRQQHQRQCQRERDDPAEDAKGPVHLHGPAEREAAGRGCQYAYVDTMSYQAPAA